MAPVNFFKQSYSLKILGWVACYSFGDIYMCVCIYIIVRNLYKTCIQYTTYYKYLCRQKAES